MILVGEFSGIWMGFEWDLSGILVGSLVGFEWDFRMGFEWDFSGSLVWFHGILMGF